MRRTRNRKAFTLIELLFVIVIMGIVGVLALDAIRSYYEGIYRTGEYSKRVAQADHILEQIAKYFENGVSASIIRLDENDAPFGSRCDGVPQAGDDNNDYTIAFVAVDDEGMRSGFWDGVRWRPGWTSDVLVNGMNIIAPDANYTAMDNLIPLALNNNSRAAVFRSDGLAEGLDECRRFGWEVPANNTYEAYSRIMAVNSDTNMTLERALSVSGNSNRAYVMRTAYAFRAKDGNFSMYSGFEPWNGEQYNSVPARLMADNVTHFTILYDARNTTINSNVGNIYTLKICMEGLEANLSSTTDSMRQICRERMVHVRY